MVAAISSPGRWMNCAYVTEIGAPATPRVKFETKNGGVTANVVCFPPFNDRKRSGEANMNERTLEVMPINSLWMLREKIDALLASKLISEKEELERRLARVTGHKRLTRRCTRSIGIRSVPMRHGRVEVSNHDGLLRSCVLGIPPKIFASPRLQLTIDLRQYVVR